MYEPTHGAVAHELGNMVVTFQGRPENHQCHRLDDGRFRVQWLVIAALDNEVSGAAFKEQKALAEEFAG